MGYYSALNLIREPFSNSPDPSLFYHSNQHLEALQQLEISIRLRRGLSVVTGDVGTGKTTLSRQLIQMLASDTGVNTSVVLDPGYDRVENFLAYILQLFTGDDRHGSRDENWLKEAIKNYLFTQGADRKKLTVLIVDEGQKLTQPCIEALRELLNYETNEHKLLQIVIFAQNEFKSVIEPLENFRDRINFSYELHPLNFKNTRGLICYRIEQSSEPGKQPPLFSFGACLAIYRSSGGYPRKIVRLCHHVILGLIVQNKRQAGYFMVRSCARKVFNKPGNSSRLVPATIAAGALLAVAGVYVALHRNPDVPVWLSIKPPQVKASVSLTAASASIPKQEPGQAGALAGKPHPLPVKLGRLVIEQNESFCSMLSAIYGACTYSVIDEVVKLSPEIRNPDFILAGSEIQFPAIPLEVDPGGSDRYIIILKSEQSLEQAWSRLKGMAGRDIPMEAGANAVGDGRCGPIPRYSELKDMPLRILSVWDEGNGLVFHVMVDRIFDDRAAAEAYMARLPEQVEGMIDTIVPRKKGTIIYSKRM